MSAKGQQLLKYAAMQSRKELDKELAQARKSYSKAKSEYEDAKSQLEGLEKRLQDTESLMTNDRQNIVDISNCIKMMDLTGAEGIRDRGDVKTYYVDGSEYHAALDGDSNDLKVQLYKDWKKEQDQPGADECMADDEDIVNPFLEALKLIKD